MSTASKLAQLRELSVVVADTGDYDAIKRLRPVDCTTNPTLVKKALDLPVYAGLIERELQWGRARAGDRQAVANAVVDRLTVGVGTMLAEEMITTLPHPLLGSYRGITRPIVFGRTPGPQPFAAPTFDQDTAAVIAAVEDGDITA